MAKIRRPGRTQAGGGETLESGAPPEEAKALSWSAFVSTYLPALILALGVGIALPGTLKLAQSFNVGYSLATGVTISFLLGSVLGTIPAGWLIDRLGRRRIMLLGPLLTSAMAFAVVVAHTFPELLFFRFVDGAAAQMWLMGRLAAISHGAAPNQRGKQVSWMFGMDNSGKFLGPAIGGIIVTHFGVRAPFAVYGVLALVALIPAFMFTKDTPRAERPVNTSGKARTISLRQLILPRLVYFGVAFFAAMARGPVGGQVINLYADYAYKLSPETLGFLVAAAGGMAVPIGFMAGWMMDRFGRKKTMVPGFSGVTLTMIGLALSAFLHFPFAWYVVIFLVGIAFQSLTGGSIQTVGADVAPPEARGVFLGIWRFTGQGGIAISPILFSLISAQVDFGAAFLFVAASAGVVSLLLIRYVPETGGPRAAAPVVMVPAAATEPAVTLAEVAPTAKGA